MKKIYALISFLILGFGLQAQQTVSLSMGPGYANQIYFGLKDQHTASAPRDAWDLAFMTNLFSASIRVNSGAGTQLYLPVISDTSAWATADTAGMIPVYDSDTSWDESAFNYGHGGHPDYGWGHYLSGGTLIGKRIFIIQLQDGQWKKIWIQKLDAGNTYTIRLANLDNTADTTFQVKKTDYQGKRFFYYNLRSMEALDLDPPIADWDLIVTRYSSEVAPGIYYPVVGVLGSGDVEIAEARHVDTSISNYSGYPFSSNISVIGYDWKAFDRTTNQYVVEDSLIYWVRTPDSSVYKIIFTSFEGSSTGNLSFKLYKMNTGTGVDDPAEQTELELYPNPASDQLRIKWKLNGASSSARLALYNTAGLCVWSDSRELTGSGHDSWNVDVSSLPSGIYLLQIREDKGRGSIKKVIR